MLTRRDEVKFYSFTKDEKWNYLKLKYLTPQHYLTTYLSYFPNTKEYFNNAFWRVSLDPFIELIPGLDTDIFYREFIYNFINMPASLYSSLNAINIGYSDNTYTWNHSLYSVLRGISKTSIICFYHFTVDSSKAYVQGGLADVSMFANYLVDSVFRWIPYSTERAQLDNAKDLYSYEFFTMSALSGAARTAGAQVGGIIAKSVFEHNIKNFLLQPFAIYFKLQYEGKTFSKLASTKDTGYFLFQLSYEISSKLLINYANTIVMQPLSRVCGIATEEFTEYFFSKPDTMGELSLLSQEPDL